MTSEERSGNDGLQGLFALVGITLGVVPLVRVVIGGEVGRVLRWVPWTDDAPGSWLVPLGIVLVCTVIVLALDRDQQ